MMMMMWVVVIKTYDVHDDMDDDVMFQLDEAILEMLGLERTEVKYKSQIYRYVRGCP